MKIFISHSSQDKWFADKIVTLLDQLGVSVWYDKIDLYIGDNLLQKIHAGLQESSHLIVILSRQSIVSKWVKEELESFYTDFVLGGKAKIYPLLLEDVWEATPAFLKKLVYADFRNSTPDSLNPAGIAEIEKEFRGVPVSEGALLKCYRLGDMHRILVTLPADEGRKSKSQINLEAQKELAVLRGKLAGKDVMLTGRTTYTLALMIGAYLGNICKSLQAFDPKREGGHEFVTIFLPS